MLRPSVFANLDPGPSNANVSGGNRIEIDVRALPDFGHPRGFNNFAADATPKISGNTSRALRARTTQTRRQSGWLEPGV
jgi:hypothetical protein